MSPFSEELDGTMEDYEAVCDYLLRGTYPTGFSKNQRRVLRRKTLEHFELRGGILYYSGTSKQRAEEGIEKIVVKSNQDKKRIQTHLVSLFKLKV